MKWFGRDPAWYTNLFAVLVMAFSTFFLPLTEDQQGALNAVAIGVAGAIVAHQARADGQLALVVNLFKAVLALALSFGLHMTEQQQLVIMAVVTAVGSGFIRTQIAARVPAPSSTADKVVVVNK
jgi:hypothetical protein